MLLLLYKYKHDKFVWQFVEAGVGKQIGVTKLIATFFSIALIFRTPIAYIKEIKGCPQREHTQLLQKLAQTIYIFIFMHVTPVAENSTGMNFLCSTIDGVYLYLQICSVLLAYYFLRTAHLLWINTTHKSITTNEFLNLTQDAYILFLTSEVAQFIAYGQLINYVWTSSVVS